MKIKKIGTLVASFVISVSSLAAVGFNGVAHAATTGTYYEWTGASSATAGNSSCTLNCWSVAGNWDVSTNGGSTYTTATTAPNSTDNSGDGDNLVFNLSNLTAATTVNDDITNLTVDTITLTGSGSYSYTINGNSFSLVNGLIGDESGYSASTIINNNITFSSSQTINPAEFILGGTLTIPTNSTLTVDGSFNMNALAGNGSLVLDQPSSSGSNSFYSNDYILNPSTFSGSIEINSGVMLSVNAASSLGTATLNIASGGQLTLPSASGSSTTNTINNTINMAGDGAGAAGEDQGAIYQDQNPNSSTGTNVDLTGTVTLTGNTQLAGGSGPTTTYNITGTYNAGGFSLTPVPASPPTYGTTVIELNGNPITGTTTSSTTTSSTTTSSPTSTKKTAIVPKTPDTGIGLASDNIGLPIVGTVMMAGGLYVISRKVNKRMNSK